MKKRYLLAGLPLAAAALAFWCFFPGRTSSRRDGAAAGIASGPPPGGPETRTMYNCAMHPQYISDKPGKCPFCGMDLTPMGKAESRGERRIAYYRDPMHPWITSDRPGPSPEGGADMAPVYAGEETAQGIRIDPVTVQNMGVRTAPVEKRVMSPEIRAGGKVAVDETRQFSVNARVMGWVEKLWAASTGQAVRKGEPLLELYSPELLSTQEEYLQALRYVRSLESPIPGAAAQVTGDPGAAAQSPGEEARRGAAELLESSRRRLLNWDVPEAMIRDLEKRGNALRTLPVLSPATGVVLEKMVMQGQNIMPGMPLYRIADLSRVWVVASVYQGDLHLVRAGSQAEILLSYLPGKSFRGRVAFVSPVLDPGTRTAEVRIEVPNTPSLDLKPEMLATVLLRPPASGPRVAVPEQAIIRSGRRDVAIIALGGGYFEPREVKLGRSADGYVEVTEGLREGERLVISSQFLIDSESNLKAAIRQMQAPTRGAAGAAEPSPGTARDSSGGRP